MQWGRLAGLWWALPLCCALHGQGIGTGSSLLTVIRPPAPCSDAGYYMPDYLNGTNLALRAIGTACLPCPVRLGGCAAC